MTVDDFLYYCMDAGMLKVDIYDFTSENVVWSGWSDEVPDEILAMELESFDAPTTPHTLTINVDSDDEEEW